MSCKNIILLTVLLLTACNDGNEAELSVEIARLRKEVQELGQLRHDVRLAEEEIEYLRGRLKPEEKPEASKSDKRPIVPVRFTPDGSHLNDPFLGPKEAPVIVMAFGDFQCGPCKKFYINSFPKLKAEFADSGKIQFIFRDFPLRSNAQARRAAVSAHCAGEQGQYWEMFALLYENQDRIEENEIDALEADLSNVNPEKLQACVKSRRYKAEIDRDIAEGKLLGAKGAPGFFVGHQREDSQLEGIFIRGAQPYPLIRAKILKTLERANANT